MTYSITLSNGTPLPIVNEAVKDNTTTSISLVGKNYANYGIVLNENFVHILENFSNAAAPANPLEGQLWWNSGTKNLRVYTGNSWKNIVSTAVGTTQPPAPSVGDQWFDTAAGQLKIWDSTKWLNLGPQASTLVGLNGTVAEAILDTGNPPQTHVVIKHYINDVVVSIDSKDSIFTPAVAIAGFSTIAPGINVSSAYATPTSNISLTSKQYVDSAISSIPTFSLADGTVTPLKLSTGGPSWNAAGNLSVTGAITTQIGVVFPDGTTQTTAANVGGAVSVTNIMPSQLSAGGPYWNTTGNVGIGTTTPNQKITIATGANVAAGITFWGNSSTSSTEVFVGQGSGSEAFFYNRGNNILTLGTNNTERVRITSAGDVGIGTIEPRGKLEIYGANAAQVFKTDESTSGYTYTQGLDDTSVYFKHNSSSRGFRWIINNSTEVLRVAANGNVGIGTSSPTRKLHIVDGTSDAQIVLRASDSSGPQLMMGANVTVGGSVINATSVTGTSISTHSLIMMTGGNERVRITSDGYVGIGTVNPTQKLTVAGTIESTSGGFKFPDGTTQTTAFSAAASGGLGVGQTWQNVTSSRSVGVTYYNTTGKPIAALITSGPPVGSGLSLHMIINGLEMVVQSFGALSAFGEAGGTVIIPINASYSVKDVGHGVARWYELR